MLGGRFSCIERYDRPAPPLEHSQPGPASNSADVFFTEVSEGMTKKQERSQA